MWALKLKPDGVLKWMRHYIESDGHVKAQIYKTFKEANSVANEFNKAIRERVSSLGLSDELRLSISLQAEKSVTAEERLAQEEQLMLAEANRRSLSFPKPDIHDLILPAKDGEKYRNDLYQSLCESPKIQIVQLSNHRVSLRRKGEFDWSTVITTNAKTGQYCFRERIASAFDMSGVEHWGETKAKIRDLLLPRANKLLQIASVQRMLDEALARGQHVLVVGSFVFWYEQGKEVGWTVKSLGGNSVAKDGETLWKEGKIVSKNHGRIVVLPYIKENGELVQGHTKNSPKDGKALPRHPDYFLELPFEVLDGDLMIGLFGELPYE